LYGVSRVGGRRDDGSVAEEEKPLEAPPLREKEAPAPTPPPPADVEVDIKEKPLEAALVEGVSAFEENPPAVLAPALALAPNPAPNPVPAVVKGAAAEVGVAPKLNVLLEASFGAVVVVRARLPPLPAVVPPRVNPPPPPPVLLAPPKLPKLVDIADDKAGAAGAVEELFPKLNPPVEAPPCVPAVAPKVNFPIIDEDREENMRQIFNPHLWQLLHQALRTTEHPK
jgi:hypothetical protein